MTDISRHPILRDCYEVCLAIERCGASEELTEATIKASALMAALETIVDRGEASLFLVDMQAELHRAETQHSPYNSYHEAYAVILEEVDEFWEIVRQKTAARDPVEARKELIQIAVTAWRTARDILDED